MASNRRDQLIDTALALFYRDGYHATGIDKILAEAGVAKMTLYKHFKSKDELILAALHRRDERFRNWFMRAVERLGATPRERLLAVFDAMDEWFSSQECPGCMFINASAEYAKDDDPIRATAAEHKRLVLGYIRDLATAAGATNPDELAHGIMLLREGAVVLARISRSVEPVRRARKAAAILVRDAFERPAEGAPAAAVR